MAGTKGVMRIIAGEARGRRIFTVPSDSGVRPILARIRQSLFDILRPKVPGAAFLDLFAGTGAVGLEALSRGAGKVVFLEKERLCQKAIERNLAHLGFEKRAVVLKGDATSPLAWLLYHTQDRPFDLVFMGPPYVDKEKRPIRLVGQVLARLAEPGLLAPDGLIVAQHHKKEPFEVPPAFKRFRLIPYGDSVLSFVRHRKAAAAEAAAPPEPGAELG